MSLSLEKLSTYPEIWTYWANFGGPSTKKAQVNKLSFSYQGHHQLSPEKSILNQGQMTEAP